MSARSRWSLLKTINGALVGMVSSSAGCNLLQSWASFLMGVIASIAYLLTVFVMERAKVDDPLEAVAGKKRILLPIYLRHKNKKYLSALLFAIFDT